jgi:hypothetical protein
MCPIEKSKREDIDVIQRLLDKLNALPDNMTYDIRNVSRNGLEVWVAIEVAKGAHLHQSIIATGHTTAKVLSKFIPQLMQLIKDWSRRDISTFKVKRSPQTLGSDLVEVAHPRTGHSIYCTVNILQRLISVSAKGTKK